jgi:ABC-type protease/lipase transport system fused ATPase/permease subunit
MRKNGDSGAPTAEAKDLLREVLANCRAYFLGVGVLSMAINLLMLTTSLYMMQVFDRVLGSGSRETLIYLTVIACGAVLLLAVLDAVRSRTFRPCAASSAAPAC